LIHLCSSDERTLLEIVAHMAEASYHLPTDVPDPTVKRPAWMPPGK
jgi:hypothetical protein